MTSFAKDVVGFFEEPTTYKHDFNKHPAPSRAARETEEKCPAAPKAGNRSPGRSELLKTITSYDTLQKLDYEARIPFDAMLRPKEIVGTHPRQTFCRRIMEDEGLAEAIKTRPRRYVSPAISLDNVEDRDTRKLVIDFTYMTTSSRAGKEAWAGFKPIELCLPNTVFEKTVNPLATSSKLLPDIPAGFQAAARKWDGIQERYRVDTISELSKSGKTIDHSDRLSELVTASDKHAIRKLIAKNKLSLPYDRMPLSYGGFRPQFGFGVPLEVKESSPFDPSLSVAKAITAREAATDKIPN